jgi:hypothetical protein
VVLKQFVAAYYHEPLGKKHHASFLI